MSVLSRIPRWRLGLLRRILALDRVRASYTKTKRTPLQASVGTGGTGYLNGMLGRSGSVWLTSKSGVANAGIVFRRWVVFIEGQLCRFAKVHQADLGGAAGGGAGHVRKPIMKKARLLRDV